MKVLWIDTETTGIDPTKNEILTVAGIVEIDGQVMEEFNFQFRPTRTEHIEPKALEVNKLKLEDVMKFPPPIVAYRSMVAIFGKYVDKFDRNDKFIIGGQNVRFDIDFLKRLWESQGDVYFGSWCGYHTLDTMTMAMTLKYLGWLKTDNFKLESIAKAFGIEFQAHDALEDIRTSRKVALAMLDIIRTGNKE